MRGAKRTSYARAAAGYGGAHERELRDVIITAIAEASRVTDANAMIIRTSEAAAALVNVLTVTLAMSPAAARSPTAIRCTCGELRKRLLRQLRQAERDPGMQDFVRRAFRGTGTGGSA